MIDNKQLETAFKSSIAVLIRELDLDGEKPTDEIVAAARMRTETEWHDWEPGRAHRIRTALAEASLVRSLDALYRYVRITEDLDGVIAYLETASAENASLAEDMDRLGHVRRMLRAGDMASARDAMESRYGIYVPGSGHKFLKAPARALLDSGLPGGTRNMFLCAVADIPFLPDRIPGL